MLSVRGRGDKWNPLKYAVCELEGMPPQASYTCLLELLDGFLEQQPGTALSVDAAQGGDEEEPTEEMHPAILLHGDQNGRSLTSLIYGHCNEVYCPIDLG